MRRFAGGGASRSSASVGSSVSNSAACCGAQRMTLAPAEESAAAMRVAVVRNGHGGPSGRHVNRLRRLVVDRESASTALLSSLARSVFSQEKPPSLSGRAAEMAVGRGAAIDRPVELERAADVGRRQREDLAAGPSRACARRPCRCRACRPGATSDRRRRSRRRPGWCSARRGRRPPRSWRGSAPHRRPSGRPWSDPCRRTRRRRAGRSRRRCRR